jgi:hypothetical protein
MQIAVQKHWISCILIVSALQRELLQYLNRFGKVTETSLVEARKIIAPLLRDLPDDVREALRSWYVKGESAEAICINYNFTPVQFSEMKQALRARFVELRGR